MKQENIRVSVIMGVYNSNVAQLSKAIESILNQSYGNFEFIICDDCSSKKEVKETLIKFQKLDNRIRLIRNNHNSGLASSLNNCLKISSGEYIARMDDDDFSHPDRFEKQVDFLNTHPDYDLVGCAVNMIDDSGIWGKVYNKECPQKEDFMFATPFTHPTIMVRAEAYRAVNGYSVTSRTKRTEDYDMFMRMYAKDIKGFNIQEILFDYRMDSSGYKKQKFKYRIDELVIKYRGFKALGLFPKGYVFLFKPLISGLVPQKVKSFIHKMRFSRW